MAGAAAGAVKQARSQRVRPSTRRRAPARDDDLIVTMDILMVRGARIARLEARTPATPLQNVAPELSQASRISSPVANHTPACERM